MEEFTGEQREFDNAVTERRPPGEILSG